MYSDVMQIWSVADLQESAGSAAADRAPLKISFAGPPPKQVERMLMYFRQRRKQKTFVCLFVCLYVCFLFVLLFTFWNDWNLFWVYQNGNFTPLKGPHRKLLTGPISLNQPLNMMWWSWWWCDDDIRCDSWCNVFCDDTVIYNVFKLAVM